LQRVAPEYRFLTITSSLRPERLLHFRPVCCNKIPKFHAKKQRIYTKNLTKRLVCLQILYVHTYIGQQLRLRLTSFQKLPFTDIFFVEMLYTYQIVIVVQFLTELRTKLLQFPPHFYIFFWLFQVPSRPIAKPVARPVARSQVLRFGGAKYIFRGAKFLLLLYV